MFDEPSSEAIREVWQAVSEVDKRLKKFDKKLSKVKIAQADLREPETCLQDCRNV